MKQPIMSLPLPVDDLLIIELDDRIELSSGLIECDLEADWNALCPPLNDCQGNAQWCC